MFHSIGALFLIIGLAHLYEFKSEDQDLFNVLLIQRTDGNHELCIPLNFTDAFMNLAIQHNMRNKAKKREKTRKRKERDTQRIEKFILTKRELQKILSL